jgi:capsule biosynthesis phosphatase
MKRLVIDLDGTITQDDPVRAYSEKLPDLRVVARMRDYKAMGFTIVVHTARSMRSFENSVGLIAAHTLPVIIDWLKANDIPYDEIHIGKPWCGTDGFYVDDRAIRPGEFVSLSLGQIHTLLESQSSEDTCK